jgi:uncharacterized protein (TIGR03086 family)
VIEAAGKHIHACQGFSGVVARAGGHWQSPSPCDDWDARGVVEHVIGFHDVLLLRPLDAKPTRLKGDPVARWAATSTAITSLLQNCDENNTQAVKDAAGIDFGRLLPMLTTEVLVHTWDLARAVGVDAGLDPDLCAAAYHAAQANQKRLRGSGLYSPPEPAPENASMEIKLVALLGRDPSWRAP